MLRYGIPLLAFTIQALAVVSPSVGQPALKTYQSEKFGYSIQYPETHQSERQKYPTQKFPNQERVRFEGPGVAYMVAVSQSKKLGRISNEELISMMEARRKMMEKALRQSSRDPVEVRKVTQIHVSDREALLIEGKEIGRDILALMVLFKKGDRQFQVVARTAPANWKASPDAILRVLKSIEVE